MKRRSSNARRRERSEGVGRRGRRAKSKPGVVLAIGLSSLWVLACSAPLGGWDVAQLLREESAVAALEAQRLGDMIPFPAIESGEGEGTASLVACRWATQEPIRVGLRLSGERIEWARRAIASLSSGVPGVEFEITSEFDLAIDAGTGTAMEPHAVVAIREVEAVRDLGPLGVGDTLVECDVAPRGPAGFGRLVRAEIRMRSVVFDQLDEPVAVAAEDWTGALMHELGHALGFQGHLRAGDSILSRDQSRLRRAGRAALAGEPWKEPTLEALYRLEPGRRLGARALSAHSRDWLAAIERAAARGAIEGPVARAGDRHADLEWRTAEGETLRLRFPFWVRQLRAGGEVVALPGPATRAALTGAVAGTGSRIERSATTNP